MLSYKLQRVPVDYDREPFLPIYVSRGLCLASSLGNCYLPARCQLDLCDAVERVRNSFLIAVQPISVPGIT
eukprot:3107450-Rhodomonas_salina.4